MAFSLKTSKPKLYKQLIKLIDKKNLNIEDIGSDPSILKLNNNKPLLYATVKRIILNERGKEVLNKIQSIKKDTKPSEGNNISFIYKNPKYLSTDYVDAVYINKSFYDKLKKNLK